MSYSKEIVNIVKTFFKEDDWHYDFDEDNGIFTGGINIEGKLGSVRFISFVQEEFMTNYVQIKLQAEENVRKNVSEYLTRANYGLNYGCFEMDFKDGEIRYRMLVSLEELQADYKNALAKVLLIPCKMIEKYGDGLLAVMFGMATPEEAITKAEGK